MIFTPSRICYFLHSNVLYNNTYIVIGAKKNKGGGVKTEEIQYSPHFFHYFFDKNLDSGQQNPFLITDIASHKFERFRLQVWEDVLPYTQLENVSIIDHIQVSSRIECSQRCVIEPECKSINICYRRICQLNIEDRFSKGGQLEQNDTCLYVGMKQKYVPQCREKGTDKRITDDRYPGKLNLWLFFWKNCIWIFHPRIALSTYPRPIISAISVLKQKFQRRFANFNKLSFKYFLCPSLEFQLSAFTLLKSKESEFDKNFVIKQFNAFQEL